MELVTQLGVAQVPSRRGFFNPRGRVCMRSCLMKW